MVSYFKKTKLDAEFYDEFIKDRLPRRIIDMHLHISKPEFKVNCVPDPNDWSIQCGSDMSIEDYESYRAAFYPDTQVEINALPSVTKGIDVEGNDRYISDIKKSGRARYAHCLTDPSWSAEYTERILLEGDFDGYKPYPDFVSGFQGVDIGLFDFVTHEQLAVLNKHKKSMVLHLPRAGRFPDDNNIREILTVADKYPDIRLIIAHCGRCYAIDWIKRATEKLKDSRNRFSYDLAAVLNPEVLSYMLEHYPHDRIMYGTDLPIFLWHGRRRWTNTEYFNLCREDFPFNRHEQGEQAEAGYTFFLYEQMKNILDTVYEHGGRELAEDVFYNNAVSHFSK